MAKYEDGLVKGVKEILADEVLDDMVAKAVASAIDRQVRECIDGLMGYSVFQLMIQNRVKEILAEED